MKSRRKSKKRSRSKRSQSNTKSIESVVVVGSGPAAYTACIYLGRANLKPLMLEGIPMNSTSPGGLLMTTHVVENFPGFSKGVEGKDLISEMKEQASRAGTRIRSEWVDKITRSTSGLFVLHIGKKTIKAKSVIVATGSVPNKLDVPGFDEFWYKGVSTCAVCDGSLPMFRNQPLAVVGGGDSACEEALYLANLASKVYLIHRRDVLRASKVLQDRVLSHPKITVLWNQEVEEIKGTKTVESIRLSNRKGELAVKGVFVAIGHKPGSQLVKDLVKCDSEGYIEVNDRQETSVSGLFAAGDVHDREFRQAITAAGSGEKAGISCERWLATL